MRTNDLYMAALSETVVLIDGAVEICAALADVGEVGIITNGIEHIQARRIATSSLHRHISFVATSEACGYAKPDERFFAYCAGLARAAPKHATVIIGDRLDADILGANRYGIDAPDRPDTPECAGPARSSRPPGARTVSGERVGRRTDTENDEHQSPHSLL